MLTKGPFRWMSARPASEWWQSGGLWLTASTRQPNASSTASPWGSTHTRPCGCAPRSTRLLLVYHEGTWGIYNMGPTPHAPRPVCSLCHQQPAQARHCAHCTLSALLCHAARPSSHSKLAPLCAHELSECSLTLPHHTSYCILQPMPISPTSGMRHQSGREGERGRQRR